MKADFLDQLERQLVEATEQGGKRRRFWQRRLRLPTLAVAAVAVTAVTATALAAELALPVAHVKHAAARAKSSLPGPDGGATAGAVAPPSGPVPAGFQPESFTAISEFSWWLLGTAPCGSPPCTSIVRTDNGGASFVGMPAPRTDHVSQLRFADMADGYAFGPQLWDTHDGGSTWARVRLGGPIDDLEAAGGYVYAEVSTAPRSSALMRSPVGRDDWVKLSGLPDRLLAPIWVQGSTVIVAAPDGENAAGLAGANVFVSDDYGNDFIRTRGQPPSAGCDYDATADAAVIWAECSAGMGSSAVARSVDGGVSFPLVLDSGGAAESFAAASATTAVVGGGTGLRRTVDGGRSWSAVQGLPQVSAWTYLGFTDPTHGAAIAQFGTGSGAADRLYYTTDAGASYHFVPIAPA